MKKFNKIAEFGKKLMSMDDMNNTIELIADEAKELVGAQRCSIFIVDNDDEMLWTTLSDGIGKIVVALDAGVVGATYTSKAAQVVNNPYEDERFLPNIDKKSGYITQNMITVPIFNSKREVMGVIQLLNKETDFDEEDLETLTFFANYVSGSLELALISSKA
ncbi:GAF domain-containing protein [Sulfurimonas autotrophica]|uniref:Putative GAF sensor protein n=1 Tax=Sulfurimonas autotrophica (strain ATCC BAA-671 / DSM 16294 / JCM 11897 / OK10) TaxID=563040 RepID=E0URI2_SULAO|nr:GAF domain-containing protein [Sulfurimonas autotrophica]ADN10068.1 putative GAF sensor protein [Sulfurimonas autotrophica DSM 16294]